MLVVACAVQLEHQADQAVRESLPGVGAVRLRATIHH